jgi:hypothetical protein
MGEPIVRATHGSPEKPLRIGTTIAIPCYVLEDGRRVLAHAGMLTALDMVAGGIGNAGSNRLANFITSKRLRPYIPSRLARSILQPILFRAPRAGRFAYGYEATVLADLCDAILEARKRLALEERQRHIAERAEVLVRAFARVGIIALVDEVTGYQADRDRDALHKILAAYVSPELLPWAKRFPDEFYQHMFRLRGWTFDPQHGPRGPRLAGLLTVQLVYDKLPPPRPRRIAAEKPGGAPRPTPSPAPSISHQSDRQRPSRPPSARRHRAHAGGHHVGGSRAPHDESLPGSDYSRHAATAPGRVTTGESPVTLVPIRAPIADTSLRSVGHTDDRPGTRSVTLVWCVRLGSSCLSLYVRALRGPTAVCGKTSWVDYKNRWSRRIPICRERGG